MRAAAAGSACPPANESGGRLREPRVPLANGDRGPLTGPRVPRRQRPSQGPARAPLPMRTAAAARACPAANGSGGGRQRVPPGQWEPRPPQRRRPAPRPALGGPGSCS